MCLWIVPLCNIKYSEECCHCFQFVWSSKQWQNELIKENRTEIKQSRETYLTPTNRPSTVAGWFSPPGAPPCHLPPCQEDERVAGAREHASGHLLLPPRRHGPSSIATRPSSVPCHFPLSPWSSSPPLSLGPKRDREPPSPPSTARIATGLPYAPRRAPEIRDDVLVLSTESRNARCPGTPPPPSSSTLVSEITDNAPTSSDLPRAH